MTEKNMYKDIEKDIRKNSDIDNDSAMSEAEGGFNGWMTVAGSWLILFSTLGYVYSFGVYEDYYTRIFLRGQSPSKISWMGSLQLALPFAMGPFAGKLFAAGHARATIASGSLLYIFSLFMLSLAKEGQYYQILLSQGLGMGIGTGLVFTTSTAIVGIHFTKRRSFALGIALTGMSIGALTFPILINQLIPKVGFGSAVRASGYVTLGALVVGNLLIRLPPRFSKKIEPVDISSFFRDSVYLWYLCTSVIALLSVYFPSFYLQLYAIEHNIDSTLSFYSIAILNGVGTVGRIGGSLLADKYGVWNMLTLVSVGTAATVWMILAVHNSTSLVVISCLYGIFSGAWLVLGVSGLVSLARSPDEVPARVGIAYAFMSLGVLASGPIQGALLSQKFQWVRPIAFAGTLMLIVTVVTAVVRTLIVKRKNSQWI